jgi:hypothetical protein
MAVPRWGHGDTLTPSVRLNVFLSSTPFEESLGWVSRSGLRTVAIMMVDVLDDAGTRGRGEVLGKLSQVAKANDRSARSVGLAVVSRT